jgi:hypothetical protein
MKAMKVRVLLLLHPRHHSGKIRQNQCASDGSSIRIAKKE